ncbi:MBL fold metallo-hydrolase [Tateyamaria sp.]|uniref:MBL fold metallo-hydrolase n=1 Tax=Tateyamaria sp. TaxID=1929288 RepID=UPI0032A085E1
MSKPLLSLALAASTVALTSGVFAPSAMAQEVQRGFLPVAGDVYRFRNNFHFSMVVVTDAGVVVVDPINADAATWLKGNLSEITDKPITHLIYSHSHLDHASGGAALEASNVIAQANAPTAIDGVAPTQRFDDTMVFEHGGKTIELTYLGPGHGEDLIAVVVRPENVAFITDVAAPKRLPFRTMPSSSPDAWVEQAKKANTLDFEVFAPAHGPMGVKADLDDVITYMETMRAEVLEGIKSGASLADIQDVVLMEDYSGWLNYDTWRTQNVQGWYDFLVK